MTTGWLIPTKKCYLPDTDEAPISNLQNPKWRNGSLPCERRLDGISRCSVHATVIKDYGSIRFDGDDNRYRAGRRGTIPSIIRAASRHVPANSDMTACMEQ